MDSRAGPSRSKNRSKTSTPSSRKKRWLSEDSEGSEGFSDEEVCSQRAQEEQLSSSSEESSYGSDDSIFDTRLKLKTLSRGPPAQSSRSSAAKTTKNFVLTFL